MTEAKVMICGGTEPEPQVIAGSSGKRYREREPRWMYEPRTEIPDQRSVLDSIAHGMSNGLIESDNTKIRLITRIAFGFVNPGALIALAMLTLGGHRPTLPGRQ